MTRSYTILGINYGGHDTSAALMQDGQILSACEQERYTLDKHSRRFPVDAITDCLNQANISLSEVDELAFAFQPLYHIREAYLRPALNDSVGISRLINEIDRIKENYDLDDFIRHQTGYDGKIGYYFHHHCHLASSWYPSGFSEALLVSYDGIGEIETGLFAVGKNNDLKVVQDGVRFPNSLGLIYSAVTSYLGWRHHCDEGIVMGLASYGDPHSHIPGTERSYYEVFEDIIQEISDYDYQINLEWIAYQEKRDKWVSDKFLSVFGPRREPDGEISESHMNLAAALQLRLETIVLGQLRRAKDKYSQERLCLSGGVALNCSLNGVIERSGIFKEIFVQPASGDAGVSLGACYLAQKSQDSNFSPRRNHNFCIGSSFDVKHILRAFESRQLLPEKPLDLINLTVKRLAEGKIIGWFQGGAEFGPRALGNRSILTRPYPKEMRDHLNNRVKFREEFRPFAPAVLHEYVADYFDIRQESPHMLIASNATNLAKEKIPATIHVDNSCRVQTVKAENNEMFYRLLHAFFELTSCPVLLNTSFNIKGQPIVNTPNQAIDCFLSTNIDCLVLGEYFLEKNPPSEVS